MSHRRYARVAQGRWRIQSDVRTRRCLLRMHAAGLIELPAARGKKPDTTAMSPLNPIPCS